MMKSLFKKTISVFLSVTIIAATLFVLPVSLSVKAAEMTEVEKIVAKAESQVGDYYREDKPGTPWSGWCQAFVWYCYYSACGINASADTASLAASKWMVSTNSSNIPHGAAVYFHSSTVPSAGHVGIYVGNGYIVHAIDSGIVKQKISDISGWATFRGWGWNGGYEPSGIKYDSDVESSVTISGQNAPTVLNVGDRFWFTGTVSSAKPLSYVFAAVNDMNGNAVTSKQYFTSAYSVDIASTIDEYLIMQNLPVGKYQYYIDARDSSGYLKTLHSSEFYVVDPSKDSAAPVISNIKITDVSENGYRITCDVNDETGISKVTFPTWTEYNGQDDLVWHEAEVSGNKATLYIKASDHNNETGKYNTHIYATDWLGQVSSVSAASDEGIYVGKKTELSIKTQPKTTSAKLGEAAKITVSATGDELTYTWYFKNPGSSSFTKSGVTAAAYSMTMQQSLSGRQVYCVVTDKYGDSVKTNTVSLNLAATITKQPVTTSAADGSKLTVKIAAVGDELTYQWYYIKPGSSTPVKSGVTSANYNITMKAEYNGRRIYCVVTDKYGNTAKTNTIDIYQAVSIIEQPKNVTVSAGNKASVSVSAMGEGLTYKWYFKNPGEDTYTKSAITSSVYSVTMQSSIAGRQVYCVVTDKYGYTARSHTITISAPSVKITTQPQNATAAVGTTANIKIAA
ncbi:MAG: GBS Bsp-like repeat-containing protein, partial [Clostridia bacterium]|nr:GBS Bsp-like repeat-containing protein [Clostridia bacterium]